MDASRLGGCSGELIFGHAGVLASPRKGGRGVCHDFAHVCLVSEEKLWEVPAFLQGACNASWASLMLSCCAVVCAFKICRGDI